MMITACAGVREHAASILEDEQSGTQPTRCLYERYSAEEQEFILTATPKVTPS